MTRRPPPPRHLDDGGKTVWKRLVGDLLDHEPGTLLSLEQLCYSWSQWLSAEDDDARLRWSRACRQWLTELGLTPKSRSSRKPTQQSADPILSLMRSKAE